MLRQFHVEGFVNQFALDNVSDDGRTIVFISTAIENIAPGWRARETYRILSDNEFIETFPHLAHSDFFPQLHLLSSCMR
jgi:hypothetical protein